MTQTTCTYSVCISVETTLPKEQIQEALEDYLCGRKGEEELIALGITPVDFNVTHEDTFEVTV